MPEHVPTLFDRFHLFDFAIKVVGVGSVGTFCALGLFMAADEDPIFLQVRGEGWFRFSGWRSLQDSER